MDIKEDIKEVLMNPFRLELCKKCRECTFNVNPNNKHKPCYYEYCKSDNKVGRD